MWFRAGAGEPHLHFCLSDPFDAEAEIPQQVLLVNATSVTGSRFDDNTCLLRPGDHPRITGESFVIYSMARLATVTQIQSHEAKGLAREVERASDDLLGRIRRGLFESRRAANHYRKFLEAYEKSSRR
jgi:hypothetical protein